MADIEQNPQRKDTDVKQKQHDTSRQDGKQAPANQPQTLQPPGKNGQSGKQQKAANDSVNQRLADNDENVDSQDDKNEDDDLAEKRDDGTQDSPDPSKKNRQ